MSRGVRVVLGIVGGLLLAGLAGVLVLNALYRPVRSSGPQPAVTPDGAWMPNPASAYCEEQGGRIEVRTTADGDQYGVCILADGSECDEWAFYRNECGPAGTTGQAPELILAPNAQVPAPGQPIQVTGAGFVPGMTVALRLGVPNAGLGKLNLATAVADAGGTFEVELVLPTVWPGTQNPITERELVIAAVDETRSQTVAVAPFTNEVQSRVK
jgi:putative hemolysin